MLEKPDLPDEKIITCLQQAYGLPAMSLAFLPLGADFNTAVYRATANDTTSYFVKLRRGKFDEASVILPKYLLDLGLDHIIPILPTTTDQLWTHLDDFTVILYPFIEGRNGYRVALTKQQWFDFGRTMQRLHTAVFPHELLQYIPRETYSAHGRDNVTTFLAQAKTAAFHDSVAQKLAAFLQTKHDEIRAIVQRTAQLAQTLRQRTLDYVVCHSDVHAGNIFVDGHNHLYIVDWDDPILAPKERDLMFIGGAQGFAGCTPQEEESLFYQGYGHTNIDATALAYYRFERIIQDIAVYCDQLLLTTEGGEDREQSLDFLMSNFRPGSTIERAYAAATSF